MIDFNGPATEVFQILRSYNYEVVLFDENGNQCYEPEDARRMFCKPTNMLVSIVDDGDNSALRMYLSKSALISQLRGLIDTLRHTAPKYNMLFNVRKYGRELSPKDFATNHAVKEAKAEGSMKVFEGMYGTTRSSYLKLENARMIVRHSARINEDLIGSRGRNIHAIFVENAQGERILFPVNNLTAARAMTQHINQGGTANDVVGESIVNSAKQYAHLGQAARHIHSYGGGLNESAFDLREAIKQKMHETRLMFERMFRPRGYAEEASRITEQANMLAETGEENDGEQKKDLSENVETLREYLRVEGVDLADAVLEAVARSGALETSGVNMDEARAKVAARLNILGIPIEKDVWEAFRHGDMELSKNRPPESMPTFAKGPEADESRKSYLFQEVISRVANHSLANFLSEVNNQLQGGTAPDMRYNFDRRDGDVHGGRGGVKHVDSGHRQALLRIRDKALQNAGVTNEEARFTPESKAIRDLEEWIAGHAPERIFVEEADDPDAVIDEAVRMGNPETFTFESDLGGQSVTVTATSHPATAGESVGEADIPARISIDKVTTAEGRDIDPRALGRHRPMIEQQAIRELGVRVGDDPFSHNDDFGEMEEGFGDMTGEHLPHPSSVGGGVMHDQRDAYVDPTVPQQYHDRLMTDEFELGDEFELNPLVAGDGAMDESNVFGLELPGYNPRVRQTRMHPDDERHVRPPIEEDDIEEAGLWARHIPPHDRIPRYSTKHIQSRMEPEDERHVRPPKRGVREDDIEEAGLWARHIPPHDRIPKYSAKHMQSHMEPEDERYVRAPRKIRRENAEMDEALMSMPASEPQVMAGAGGTLPVAVTMTPDNEAMAPVTMCPPGQSLPGEADGELTMNDIVLPSNMGQDLENEVTVGDPALARMRQLAGIAGESVTEEPRSVYPEYEPDTGDEIPNGAHFPDPADDITHIGHKDGAHEYTSGQPSEWRRYPARGINRMR